MKTNQSQKNIPQGWRNLTLQEVGVKVIDGDRGKNYPHQDDFSTDGFCLFLTATNVTKQGFNFSENQFISKAKDSSMNKGRLERGDLVITTRGTIGSVASYSENVPFADVRINSGMAILRNKTVDTDLETAFLYKYFISSHFLRELKRVSFGSAQPQLTIPLIKKFKLALPPLLEQSRIISVIETWDQIIKRLTRKIEVKKQIKKSLMQDLLTGKRRLTGFGEKWKSVKLGEIASFKKGKGLPKNDLDSEGKYEAIHYGELFTKYAEYIENIISKTNYNKGMVLSKVNDILMPTSDVTPRGLSTASYLDKDGIILGGDILIIRSNGSLNGLFFCYLVNLNKKDVIKLVSGTTVFHLYGSDMAKFELKLPPIEEQEAIVKILITADKEITELEKKLSIIKEQKRYLLNNLITGTIRTPETLSAKITS